MPRYKPLSAEALGELGLDELVALADANRALVAAQKEVQFMRDQRIVELVKAVGPGHAPAIASAAGISKSWPVSIVKEFPSKWVEHLQENVDRLQVLAAARDVLDQLLQAGGS